LNELLAFIYILIREREICTSVFLVSLSINDEAMHLIKNIDVTPSLLRNIM